MAKKRVKAIKSFTEITYDERKAQTELLRPLRNQGQRFVKEAKRNAPRNTGKYAKALRFDIVEKNGVDAVDCWGGDEYTLVHILENGTTGKYGQRAKPHMRPAHNKTKDKFGDDIKEMLSDSKFLETKTKNI